MGWLTPLVMGAMLVSMIASAQDDCARTRALVVEGIGATGSNEGTRHDAIVNALANAVAESRGAFVQHQAEFVQLATSRFGDRVEVSTTRSEQVETSVQSSGLVVSYHVRSLEPSGVDGLLTATVEVIVCEDPRIAIRIAGGAVPRATLADAVESVLNETGWHVALVEGRRAPLEVALDTGATYIATLDVRARELAPWRGLERWEIESTGRVVDIMGDTFIADLSFGEDAVGATAVEARRSAAESLGRLIGRILERQLGGVRERPTVRLRFLGVTMPHVPDAVSRELNTDGRVLAVSSEQWDREAGTLVVTVDTTASACDVADVMSRMRRLLVRVHACREGHATLEVRRQ